MLSVVITEMPWRRIAMTSSKRFGKGLPGSFVCASSSISTTCGRRLTIASRSSSPLGKRGKHVEPGQLRLGIRAPVRLDEADHDVDALAEEIVRAIEHRVRFAAAGDRAEIDRELAVADAHPVADGLTVRMPRTVGHARRRRPGRIDDIEIAVDRPREHFARELAVRHRDEGGARVIEAAFRQAFRRRDRHGFGGAQRKLSEAGVRIAFVAIDDRDFNREVERFGERADPAQIGARIVVAANDDERRRRLGRAHDRNRQRVDRLQQQLAHHLQIARPENAHRRAFDVVVVNDPPAAQARLEHGRRNVERDHAVGALEQRDRHDLADRMPDDPLGRQRDRFEMLDVERAEHRFAGGAQRERILPAFRVRRARRVGMREFVEHDRLVVARDRGVEVEVFKRGTAHVVALERNARQIAGEFVEPGTALRFDPADRDAPSGAALEVGVGEQAVRLAGARRAGQIDRQPRLKAEFGEQALARSAARNDPYRGFFGGGSR